MARSLSLAQKRDRTEFIVEHICNCDSLRDSMLKSPTSQSDKATFRTVGALSSFLTKSLTSEWSAQERLAITQSEFLDEGRSWALFLAFPKDDSISQANITKLSVLWDDSNVTMPSFRDTTWCSIVTFNLLSRSLTLINSVLFLELAASAETPSLGSVHSLNTGKTKLSTYCRATASVPSFTRWASQGIQ